MPGCDGQAVSGVNRGIFAHLCAQCVAKKKRENAEHVAPGRLENAAKDLVSSARRMDRVRPIAEQATREYAQAKRELHDALETFVSLVQ